MAALPPPEGMTEEDYDSIHAAVVETVRGRWFLAEYARRSHVAEVREMLTAIGHLESVVMSNHRAALQPSDGSPHMRLLAQRAAEIALRCAEIAADFRDSGAEPYLCDDLETQVRAIEGLAKGSSPEVSSLTEVSPPNVSLPNVSLPNVLASGSAPEPRQPQLEQPTRLNAPNPPEPAVEAPELSETSLLETPNPPAASWDVPEPVLYEEPFEPEEEVFEIPVSAMESERLDSAPLEPAAEAEPDVTFRLDPRLSALAPLDRLSLTEKLALFS